MFRQRIFHRTALCTLLLILCLGLPACSTQGNNASETYVASPTQPIRSAPTTPELAYPTRLLIPAIHVDAPVEEVNIASDGNLATPAHSPWVDTGWYSDGPRPGAVGSAVIDGHLDRPGGYPAVFWLLRQLHASNTVQVQESNGQTLHFSVTDVEYYEPQNAPLQQIFGNNGGKYLNLITCAGDWIPSQHQTTLRLVVYTKLISA
jgi:sortase (surface protein transpeptidase)